MSKKFQYVGKRIHSERLKYGLNLNDLAKAVDLSPSFLSLLENGKTVPSLKVLDKISSYFSIHIAELFEEEQDEDVIFIAQNKQIEVGADSDRLLRFLLPKTTTSIEPVLITLAPKAIDNDYTIHKGIEFGYVMDGTVVVQLQNRETITCEEGDSILYQASIPHKLINPTQKTVRGLWINVPEVKMISG